MYTRTYLHLLDKTLYRIGADTQSKSNARSNIRTHTHTHTHAPCFRAAGNDVLSKKPMQILLLRSVPRKETKTIVVKIITFVCHNCTIATTNDVFPSKM